MDHGMDGRLMETAAEVDVYWLPVGASRHFVRWSGRTFEALAARLEHRRPADLYHSALQVQLDDNRYVIEMAPVWGNECADRGVVCEGAVGLPWLAHLRYFRYEVRRWRHGEIPDLIHAVDSPSRVSSDRGRAEQLLELAPEFPAYTWGRDEPGTGDMWNSNSLVSWLLSRSGHDVAAVNLPARGRAPGWSAGLDVARRQMVALTP